MPDTLIQNFNESEAFVILSSIQGLGPIKIKHLVSYFGTALQTLNSSSEAVKKIKGFEKIGENWSSWADDLFWQKDLEMIKEMKIQLIPYTDSKYPKTLLQIPDHPALLYVQGSLLPEDTNSLAIVGTRNASIYGHEMAEKLGEELASHKFTIVSGLARGIDTAAHIGALKRGRTLAVIGSGLCHIYPQENKGLAKEILKNGALITEYSMHTPPNRQNFPRRNRIVSGLSCGTLLIEAPIKSGAMITMEQAFSQRKKLFALPGRADNDNFKGNHALIKSGRASLVENSEDILSHFRELFPRIQSQSFDIQSIYLDNQEKSVLNRMSYEEMGIDALSIHLNLPINQTQTILMGLVLKKAVKAFPGKIYKKTALGHHNS